SFALVKVFSYKVTSGIINVIDCTPKKYSAITNDKLLRIKTVYKSLLMFKWTIIVIFVNLHELSIVTQILQINKNICNDRLNLFTCCTIDCTMETVIVLRSYIDFTILG